MAIGLALIAGFLFPFFVGVGRRVSPLRPSRAPHHSWTVPTAPASSDLTLRMQ